MFFLGRNFVSGLLCTLKPKNLKTFTKKPRFLSALIYVWYAMNLRELLLELLAQYFAYIISCRVRVCFQVSMPSAELHCVYWSRSKVDLG